METSRNKSQQLLELRRRAEKILLERTRNIRQMTQEDVERLIHELSVHQIELEVQNEELRLTELELQQLRDKYFDLYNLSPAGYITIDKEITITEANLSAASMLGWSKNDLIGTRFTHHVAPEFKDIFYFHQRRAMLSGAGEQSEIKLRRKDGTTFFARMEGLAVKNRDGVYDVWRVALIDVSERRQAEDALQKSHDDLETTVTERTAELTSSNEILKTTETRLLEAQRIGHMGSWEWNIENKELHWSDELYKILGLAPGTPVNFETFYSFVHPDDREAFTRVRNAVMASGKNDEIEFRITRPDGSTGHVYSHAEVTFDTNKKPLRMTGTVIDITEIMKAEAELKKSAQDYRRIIETAGEGIGIIDRESRIVFINRHMADMLGYSREEIIGHSSHEFVDEDQRDVITSFKNGLSHGQANQREFKFRRKDGTILWTLGSASPMMDEKGGYAGNFAMHTDITERKKDEENLLLQAELLNSASDAIFLRDLDGNLLYCNESMQKVFGYSIEELKRMNVIRLLPVEHTISPQMVAKMAIEQGETTVETTYMKKDGTRFPADVHVKSLKLDGRDFILGVIRDITARKKAEEELKRLPLKLIQTQENERRAIGHELHDQTGQNLTALRLFLAMAKTLPLEAIPAALEEANTITGDVLEQIRDLSHAMRPSTLDNLGLLAALRSQFDRLNRQTVISFDFKYTGLKQKLPPDVNTAAFRIVQEAVTNAIRHAGEPIIHVSVRAIKGRLHIRIGDSGRGFDPTKIGPSASNGLTGMRERALLGGNLEVQSAPGKGTTTTIKAMIPLS